MVICASKARGDTLLSRTRAYTRKYARANTKRGLGRPGIENAVTRPIHVSLSSPRCPDNVVAIGAIIFLRFPPRLLFRDY